MGIDPRWYRSPYAITFVNSMKMKLSVIAAVAQMSLGVFMKALNAIHFKSKLDFFFEFIPQIILLVGLFGYMDLLIIMKWLTNYEGQENNAPSIINVMINIPLKGAIIEGTPFIVDAETNQKVSLILLLIAVICIPIMLLPKPIILIMGLPSEEEQKDHILVQEEGDDKEYVKMLDEEEENKDENEETPGNPENNEGEGEDKPSKEVPLDEEEKLDEDDHNKSMEFVKKTEMDEGGHEAHNASEIFIHQLIETIEFVLGTISNTASYLRLWALSLAHSQLAEVFFELVFWSGIKAQNPVFIFIGFLVFATATFAVLMCMDLMECFLHTLRLHWVEFQNKFYKGDGRLFMPLTFTSISDENSIY